MSKLGSSLDQLCTPFRVRLVWMSVCRRLSQYLVVQRQVRHRSLQAAVLQIQTLQTPGLVDPEIPAVAAPAVKVCPVTPVRRAVSATVRPSAIATSASLSLFITCSGVCLFFAIFPPFYGPMPRLCPDQFFWGEAGHPMRPIERGQSAGSYRLRAGMCPGYRSCWS